MSFVLFDRNLEQMLLPITILRGGTSRGFFFEGNNVPSPGDGLEEFLLAVRGSPDPLGMDGLGANNMGQSKAAIVSPSTHADADVDYLFVQMFPDQPASISYNANCGNIAAAVPVFALMKNLIPNVSDGKVTVRAYSANTQKMMYMTLDVLNGEARVNGDTAIGGVPGTGAEVLVDFREQAGGFTGKLFPTGRLVDSIEMDDGSTVDVTIVDMVNVCAFFEPRSFGIGCTGLELPSRDGGILEPSGMADRIAELRLRVAELIGWDHFTSASIRQVPQPFAVSVRSPCDFTTLDGGTVDSNDADLVARFYLASVLHPAAPGSGSTCLGAAASIPGTIPNSTLAAGDLKAGGGGRVVFAHPSGISEVTSRPVLGPSPNDTTFEVLAYPRTARIICDGRVYIKNVNPPATPAWKLLDQITNASWFLEADDVSIQR